MADIGRHVVRFEKITCLSYYSIALVTVPYNMGEMLVIFNKTKLFDTPL